MLGAVSGGGGSGTYAIVVLVVVIYTTRPILFYMLEEQSQSQCGPSIYFLCGVDLMLVLGAIHVKVMGKEMTVIGTIAS